MYTCHVCGMKSTLNALCGRHSNKHCSERYSKEQYKIDLLNNNGRPQQMCEICSKPTIIPKGEKDYPKYHQDCYLSSLIGDNNPNWSNALKDVKCAYCDVDMKHFISHLHRKNKFCSISCSMNFYAKPENRTEAQKQYDIIATKRIIELGKTDKCKNAQRESLAKMQITRKSSTEVKFFNILLEKHPNAVDQYIMDFYTWDCFVPETNELFEINGTYWHNLPHVRSKDKSRKNFILNNRPNHTLHTIWENEIIDVSEDLLVEHARKPVQIIIVVGDIINKSLFSDFNIINYTDDVGEILRIVCEGKLLIFMKDNPKYFMKELRKNNIRVWSTLVGQEHKDKFKAFNFFGNESEVTNWILSL